MLIVKFYRVLAEELVLKIKGYHNIAHNFSKPVHINQNIKRHS
jgi:hypothetical protein